MRARFVRAACRAPGKPPHGKPPAPRRPRMRAYDSPLARSVSGRVLGRRYAAALPAGTSTAARVMRHALAASAHGLPPWLARHALACAPLCNPGKCGEGRAAECAPLPFTKTASRFNRGNLARLPGHSTTRAVSYPSAALSPRTVSDAKPPHVWTLNGSGSAISGGSFSAALSSPKRSSSPVSMASSISPWCSSR